MSDAFSDKPKSRIVGGWGVPGAILLGAAAFAVPTVALIALGPVIAGLGLGENPTSFLFSFLFDALLAATVVVFVRLYGLRVADIGVGRPKWQYLGIALLGVAVYFVLSICITGLVASVLPFDQQQVQDVGFANPSQLELLLVFAALVIMAPLGEEFLFRGFIFRGLRRRLPFWATAVIVSILFALIHGQVNVGIDVFALSLVLCYLREKTNSLWPCLFLHATKNLIAFCILYFIGTS